MKKADLEKPFEITTVCRKDLVEAGIPRKEVASLTDDDMQELAEQMGLLYVELGCFWDGIHLALERLTAKRQRQTSAERPE